MIATELRWDFDKIDELPWTYVSDLLKYWNKTPPMNQLAKLYAEARGMRIRSVTETTDFEMKVQQVRNLDTSGMPAHLKQLLVDIEQGKVKYAKR